MTQQPESIDIPIGRDEGSTTAEEENESLLRSPSRSSPASPFRNSNTPRLRIRKRGVFIFLIGTLLCGTIFVKRQSSKLLLDPKRRSKHKKTSPVDSPPVHLNGTATLESLIEQSRAIQAVSGPVVDVDTTTAGVPNYPIIVDKDDDLPLPASSTMHAAEALLCRKSVINFVINATDGKDECEGLKKAFDKTCSNDDTDRTGGRRRILWEKTQHRKRVHLFFYDHYLWLRRSWRALFTNGPDFFFAEDAVVDLYDDASCLVDHDLDQPFLHQDLRRQWQREHRRLEESGNKTAAVVPKTPVNLALPTSSQIVSEKVLSETYLLQQGDKMIEKAQNESKKHATAINDAKASSKAMADTSAAVSALLNDPTSVEARTCCASILKVYHENCSTDDEEQISDSRLFFVVFVMAMCGMVKSLIRHFKVLWLPEAAGCILVGVLSGYVLMVFPHSDISFDGNWFLRILVPPIIFEAALSIDKRSFNRHVVPILIYAVAGTLFATGLTAYIVHRGTTFLRGFCEPIPYAEALTFGALISSIDPIAVLSVLSNMGMTDTDTIYVVIFGESLLNDGVAIVLFHTLVHFLDENLVIDSDAVSAATVHFFIVAFGSLLVGVASGTMSTIYYWLFQGCQTPLVEVLMFICWALLPYYVCDGIGWSGIVSAVATGFVMDLYIVGQKMDEPLPDESEDRNGDPNRKNEPRRRIFSAQGLLSDEARQHIGFVTEIIATTMETAIFAYLGLFLFSHRYHWNFFHTVIAISACCLSRAAMIPTLSFVANWVIRMQQHRAACRPQRRGVAAANTPAGVVIDKRMQLVLWFAGLRGAMSFALVEHIPLYDSVSGEGTRLKPELKAMTSASIMFTVFILGGYTYYVMEYLGLAPASASRKGSSHSAYEMVTLISKSASGEDFDAPLDNKPSDTTSKRQLAFRRQRHTTVSETGSSDEIQFQ